MKTISTILFILSFTLNYLLAQPAMGTTSANGVNIIYQDGFNATSLQTTGSPYDVTKWQRSGTTLSISTSAWSGISGYETGSTHSIQASSSVNHILWSPVINLPAGERLFARIIHGFPGAYNSGGNFTYGVGFDSDNNLTADAGTFFSVTMSGGAPYVGSTAQSDWGSGAFFPTFGHRAKNVFIDLTPYAGQTGRVGIYLNNHFGTGLFANSYLDWFVVGTVPSNDICSNAITLTNGINGGTNGYYNSTAAGLRPFANAGGTPGNNQGGSCVYVGTGNNGLATIPTDGTRRDGYEPPSPGPFGTTTETVENSIWFKFTTPPDPLLCGQAPGAPLSVRFTFTNLSCASTLLNIPTGLQVRAFDTGLCGTNSLAYARGITGDVINGGIYNVTGLSYNTEYYLLVDGPYANDCKFNITTETFINGVSQPSSPCVILPIELTYFNASNIEDSKVRIDWTTASERNNDYFTIERSIDGKIFHEIERVKGANNSLEELNYTTFDYRPNFGMNYYRLSQTDNDGVKKSFDIDAVMIGAEEEILIVPNPNNGKFFVVSKNGTHGENNIVITDMEGRIVFSETTKLHHKENGFEINLANLMAGTYILTVRSENKITQSKIFITK